MPLDARVEALQNVNRAATLRDAAVSDTTVRGPTLGVRSLLGRSGSQVSVGVRFATCGQLISRGHIHLLSLVLDDSRLEVLARMFRAFRGICLRSDDACLRSDDARGWRCAGHPSKRGRVHPPQLVEPRKLRYDLGGQTRKSQSTESYAQSCEIGAFHGPYKTNLKSKSRLWTDVTMNV